MAEVSLQDFQILHNLEHTACYNIPFLQLLHEKLPAIRNVCRTQGIATIHLSALILLESINWQSHEILEQTEFKKEAGTIKHRKARIQPDTTGVNISKQISVPSLSLYSCRVGAGNSL